MKINDISIKKLNGYILCRSNFYQSLDICDNINITLKNGINKLMGGIDSGNWAVSYFLSMHCEAAKEDIILNEKPEITVNGLLTDEKTLSRISVYIDPLHSLFTKNITIRKAISDGLEKSGINETVDSVKSMFQLDDERFERPISGVGNEKYRAMSAIGYSYGKEIYCFPWFSKKRFDSLYYQLMGAAFFLEALGKVVILPISDAGFSNNCWDDKYSSRWNFIWENWSIN